MPRHRAGQPIHTVVGQKTRHKRHKNLRPSFAHLNVQRKAHSDASENGTTSWSTQWTRLLGGYIRVDAALVLRR